MFSFYFENKINLFKQVGITEHCSSFLKMLLLLNDLGKAMKQLTKGITETAESIYIKVVDNYIPHLILDGESEQDVFYGKYCDLLLTILLLVFL